MRSSKLYRRSVPIAAAVAMAMAMAVTPVVAQSGVHRQLAAQAMQYCDGLPATIVGDEFDNTLVGTDGNDVIVAGGGNDTIIPGKGDDLTCAGDGDDSVSDGDGNDVIFGGEGNDQLIGGKDDDVLFGGEGDDELNGGSGNDVLSGEGGDDTLLGGRNDDYLLGGNGFNTLNGGQNTDTCFVGEDGTLLACELSAGLTAVDDEYATDEETTLAVAAPGVLTNDIDPSGMAAVTPVVGSQTAAGGAIDVNADGSFTYDPMGVFDFLAAGEVGQDIFSYTITDVLGDSSTADVSITINGVNDAPTADDQGVETSGDPVTITLTGSDPDLADDLTFSVGALNGPGTLGSVVNDPALDSATISYTPGAPDPEGNDPFAFFDFTVDDGNGGVDTGRVAINEDDGPADPPSVVGVDAKPTPPDEQVEETVTGTALEITIVAAAPLAPAPGAIGDLEFTITVQPGAGEGTVSAPVAILPDGYPADPIRSARVTYDPGSFGPTDPSDPPASTSFTFEACDAATGTTCDTAVISVEVGALAPLAPPVISNVTAAIVPVSEGGPGQAMIDLSIGGEATGPQGPPLPEDGRGPQGFAGLRLPGGGFLAQASGQTFSDQSTFLATLGLADTFDFEQSSGFPAASAVIGVVDDVDFQGRIGFAVNPPPSSGTQFMRGTGSTAPYDGPGTIDFTGLPAPIDSVGFFTGFGAVAAPAPFTRVQIYGPNLGLLHEEFIAHNAPSGSYFGYSDSVDDIVEVRLQGFEADLTTPATAQQFGIDDLTIGSQPSVRDSVVAWNVADSDGDDAGDESNADGPGFPFAPGLVSASNITSGGAGSNGRSRVHIEFDISDVAGTVKHAEVTVHTSPGTAPQDTLDTRFYAATVDGDGVLNNSDWETPANQIAGVLLPNQTGISEFTFDVTSELQAAVDAGFDYFVVQGRVVETPISTTLNRGMQIRSQCSTCAGANPPELSITKEQPDLVIDSLAHDPANPTTADGITFTAVVKNVGDATAAASTLSFDIGGEAPGGPGTLFAVPQLAPGETFSAVRNATLEVAQNYTNTAIADFGEDVAESDEQNNTATDSFAVTEQGEQVVIGTFFITALPVLGTLTTSTGGPVTVGTPLPDSMVTYTAGSGALVGMVDSFEFSATNNGGTSTAVTFLPIVAELILPDECALVGRPPGCSPS